MVHVLIGCQQQVTDADHVLCCPGEFEGNKNYQYSQCFSLSVWVPGSPFKTLKFTPGGEIPPGKDS